MKCHWIGVLACAGLSGLSGSAVHGQPAVRPNILYIVADDLGYTDIGSFGSEIPTPNLDELAFAGVRLTNLHADRNCQQSRVMLMASSGTAVALEVGSSPMSGMRGNRLRREWAILPELLQDAGYATYMAGKWDLGIGDGYTPATRGFDRSFALLDASASHFAEKFWENPLPYEDDGEPVSIADLPDDFYATDYYTDKMLKFLRSHDGERPWFAYVPYTAPHWPLQLPEEWLDRHADRYEQGYDALREERFARGQELGVIPAGATLETFASTAEPWSRIEPEQQRRQARAQEIYAGMVEFLDFSVGRLIDYLEESGQLDNTVIIFSSDHGASPSDAGLVPGAEQRNVPNRVPDRDNRLQNFGRPGSFIDHGRGFAEAATAPLKGTKGTFDEGGLRAAAFVRYPGAIPAGGVSGAFMTFLDILPTFLEIAGTEHPGSSAYKGREINAIKGRSAWRHLTGRSATVHPPTDTVGWTQGSIGALIRGQYKIINQGSGASGTPWQLYDITVDAGELRDLASQRPDLTAELAAEWERDWR